jgi:hypothetical protein
MANVGTNAKTNVMDKTKSSTNGVDPYACINGGCAKIVRRLASYGLLVECPISSCPKNFKTVCGQRRCSAWENSESIDSPKMDSQLRARIKNEFQESREEFLENRV